MSSLIHSDSLHYSSSAPSWWQASARIDAIETQRLTSTERADVVIVGAGFTGLSAALRLATGPASPGRIIVIDAGDPGWGASGRNGGFCCLGGSKRSATSIENEYGSVESRAFHDFQSRAIDHVHDFGINNGLAADFSDAGEMWVAHSERAVEQLREAQSEWRDRVSMESTFFSPDALREQGYGSATSYAGLYIDRGFGLHPLNYTRALAKAVVAAGVEVFSYSPLIDWDTVGSRHRLTTPLGRLDTEHVVFATNGYTPERVVKPLGGRIMPVLSSILVTRPLTPDEQTQQGWTTTVPTYDTLNLLHYFRMLPDGRFLFGGRGGINGANSSMTETARSLRADFERLFPHWKHVNHTHVWRGYVCISSTYSPFVGSLATTPGGSANSWAALGYHGNGVAMASYCGRTLADVITGQLTADDLPRVLTTPLKSIPLPRLRPLWLKARYAGYHLQDKVFG